MGRRRRGGGGNLRLRTTPYRADRRPQHLFSVGPVLAALGAELQPGIAQRGSWAFEGPTELIAVDTTHPISLQIWLGDQRLDSRLVIRLPLDDRVRREHVVALEPVRKAAI